MGQVFSEYFNLPCQVFHRLFHTHHNPTAGAGTIGQIVADVQTGPSLVPPKQTKKTQLPFLFRGCRGETAPVVAKHCVRSTLYVGKYWAYCTGSNLSTLRKLSPHCHSLHNEFHMIWDRTTTAVVGSRWVTASAMTWLQVSSALVKRRSINWQILISFLKV
jgi:hypothetical protein